jgi:hypothetical protein
MPLPTLTIYFHWDEKISIDGYAWSWILLSKGKKGKFMCQLVFARGLHTWNTCPLLIILFRSENIAKKQHADIQAYPVVEDTIAMLNAPNNALIGEFIHQHPMEPIV